MTDITAEEVPSEFAPVPPQVASGGIVARPGVPAGSRR
jgi:hypothetical protein